jgi:hypothetical protein
VNEAKWKGSCHTAKHKKAQRQDTGNSSVVIPPEMMECLNKTEHKQSKLLLGNKKLALYYAWGEEYYENQKNAGQLVPPRMLDSKCVKHCSLKAMYLVACHSDASVYSLTNSPEWLHGGFLYFQLPQLFVLANSMNVLDRIVVVGYDESFEDDVIIALTSFHEINFKGVQNCTEGGKSDVRCRNIYVTYGYAKQGFESEANEDGLHSPSFLNNIKSKPLIGKQYLALLVKFLLLNFTLMRSIMIAQKHYDCSSNLFHARK